MTTFNVKRNQHQRIILKKSGHYLINLIGAGASVEILAALSAKSDQTYDLTITTHHQAPHTTSTTLIKAVAQDNATVNFTGTIKVAKKAKNTTAFLTENILLASPTAKANAIPNLEIRTDEVKCSHAATIGKVDEDQLFYLMSRGLSKKKSAQLIIDGFLQPVIERIKNSFATAQDKSESIITERHYA